MTQQPLLAGRKVVVIGAGIAGLAAALRLSVSGAQVTLLERHGHVGGKIRTLPSDAGPIDAGPTVLTMRHVFDDLFAMAGTRLEDHVTLHPQEVIARHFWPDGSRLDLSHDHRRNLDAVGAFAGRKGAADFAKFHARAKALFAAFDEPMMQNATPNPAALTRKVMAQPALIPAMAPWATLAQSLRRGFADPRLAQLFGRYATYVGGSPTKAPAILSLIWEAEAQGVWVVEGGMHKLAQAVATCALTHGATILCDAHVADIETNGEKVDGITLDTGRKISCDDVVFAGDPRALATGALGPGVQSVAPQTLKAARSHSARVYSFAATPEGPELAHHNVFFGDDPLAEFHDLDAGRIPGDPTLYLCALDRGQRAPPPELERFEIIANAPPTTTPHDPEDLDRWHQQIMQRMARNGVRLNPTPSSKAITTPQMFNDLFPQSMGALYGQSPHGLMAAFSRPQARTSIKGLYLAGGGTHPGAGVPMATLSARHAVEAILSDRTSMSPLGQTAMRGGMSTA